MTTVFCYLIMFSTVPTANSLSTIPTIMLTEHRLNCLSYHIYVYFSHLHHSSSVYSSLFRPLSYACSSHDLYHTLVHHSLHSRPSYRAVSHDHSDRCFLPLLPDWYVYDVCASVLDHHDHFQTHAVQM